MGVFTPHIKGTLEKDISDQHVTLAFKPEDSQIAEIMNHFNKPIKVEIIGYGNDGKNEGLLAKISDDTPYFNEAKNVHITLSVSPDSTPVKTGDLAFDKKIPAHIPTEFYGTIAAFTAQKGVVFNKEYLIDNVLDIPPEEKIKKDSIIENGILVKYNGNDENIIIPDYITGIGKGSFTCNNSITNVVIGENVKSIGENAFAACDSLTSLTIKGELENLDKRVLLWSDNIKEIRVCSERMKQMFIETENAPNNCEFVIDPSLNKEAAENNLVQAFIIESIATTISNQCGINLSQNNSLEDR
jgi:hypothetical protein